MIKNPRTQEQIKFPVDGIEYPVRKTTERFGLMDANFEYKPAVNTDVRKTWMKFGWKPVHEHDIEGEVK
jgi:hypothetical protein